MLAGEERFELSISRALWHETLPSLSKPWERVVSDIQKQKNAWTPNGIHVRENASRTKCLMKWNLNWKGEPSESHTFMFHSGITLSRTSFCTLLLITLCC